MQRGEGVTVAVMALVFIIAVLAIVTLLRGPTGLIMTDQSVYVTEDEAGLHLDCDYRGLRPKAAVFLGYEGNYRVFCCAENYNAGSNHCTKVHRILITRTY